MLFNSYEFIFAFLPVTFCLYLLIYRYSLRAALGWLTFASLFFYAWWNPNYLILIFSSIAINYALGRLLESNPNRLILTLGVAINLLALVYFKYFNFIVENVNLIADTQYNLERIILPLAISFFTFQQIAYLVDAYRGLTKEHDFLQYCLFVTFFPQLIAGPIVHHKEMLPQFMQQQASKRAENICIGLSIFFIGLFKKVVIADNVAVYASPVFMAADSGQQPDFFLAWTGALAYTVQLYFDFSGYSDMAIGAARLFGIKLPQNFHSPYKSLSIIDFWRRWHMTLSRFLRDYLYISLGGSRKGKTRRYINLLITMLLGGIWHGAGWNFLIWGALHGGYLVINHAWRGMLGNRLTTLGTSKLYMSFAWLITFVSVVFAWVFFRATTLDGALAICKGMIGLNGVAIPNAIAARMGDGFEVLSNIGVSTYIGGGSVFVESFFAIIITLPILLFLPNSIQLFRQNEPVIGFTDVNRLYWKPTITWGIFIGVVGAIGILSLSQISEFLYFQF